MLRGRLTCMGTTVVAMSLVAGLVCLAKGSAYADPVVGFSFPTRRMDAQTLTAQASRVAALVAKELGVEVAAPVASRADLGGRVRHARDSFVAGQLDAAASELDNVIADGLAHLTTLDDPQDLLQALVTRASIGLARGEGERVGELLDRALRFEPGLELTSAERSPALRAALERARQRVGAHPEISAGDLVSCEQKTMIVARVLSERTVELSRFDRCHFVAAALLGGAIDEAAAAAALSRAGAVTTIAALPQPTVPTHRRWIFGVVGGIGLAIAVAGAGLAGSALPEYNRLVSDCAGGICAPSVARPYEIRQDVGWALIAVGGATAAGSLIAWLVTRRHDAGAK